MTVSVMATPTEPVLLKKIRYGAGELMAWLRSPMQKSIVMRIRMPMNTLRRELHHMHRGTTTDAFSTSSAVHYVGVFVVMDCRSITSRHAWHSRKLRANLALWTCKLGELELTEIAEERCHLRDQA